MKKHKFHWNWFIAILALLIVAGLVFFINYFTALADPAAHNWRLEYLKPGEPVDGYLYQGDVVIALVFGSLAVIWFVGMLTSLLFRKHSSHIAEIEAGMLIVVAYEIARAIYNFSIGSVQSLVGLLYLGALIGTIGSAYFFFKKALDGDHLGVYWLFFVAGLVLFYFASGTSNSYSILNAFSHNGDFSYWFGYAASRFCFVIFALCGAINLNFDFAPEKAE